MAKSPEAFPKPAVVALVDFVAYLCKNPDYWAYFPSLQGINIHFVNIYTQSATNSQPNFEKHSLISKYQHRRLSRGP
jgi:hypothetical protein